MLPTKNVLMLVAKPPQAMTMTTSLDVFNKKIFVIHVIAMDMTHCGNPVSITTGTTQTIASLQVLPLFAFEVEPLKAEKVLETDTIVVALAQEVALAIVIVAEIATAS